MEPHGPEGGAAESSTAGVLQLHLLRRCNLSRPGGVTDDARLPLALAEAAVADGAALGWRSLVLGGGEPLLYPELETLLGRARALGMRTAIVTNGTLLRRIGPLAADLDLVLVGLDGLGARHDTLRGHPGAFASVLRGLPGLVEAGVPFGFQFVLTRHNLHELPAMARFAAERGAVVLRLLPQAAAGRGALLGSAPHDEDAVRAWLENWQLRDVDLPIRVDLDFADLERMAVPGAALPELLSPLVIEADGTVVPLQHGFPREWSLGSVHEAPLGTLVQRWPKREAFGRLCAATLARRSAADPFLDVVQAVVEAAQGVSIPA